MSEMNENGERRDAEDATRADEEPVAAPESASGLRRKEIVVGAVAVTTIVVAVLGLDVLRGLPVLGGDYHLFARFTEVRGIEEGSPVTLAGVDVGSVAELTLEPGTHDVVLRLAIDGGRQIPEGSTASIAGVAALDATEVAIEGGPPDAPALASGDTIPTGPAGGFAGVTAEVDSVLGTASETLGEIEGLVSESRGDLTATAENVRAASAATRNLLAGEQARLRTTIRNLSELSGRMNELTRSLDELSRRGGDTLVATLDDVHDVARRMDTTLVRLQASSGRLESILTAVDSGEGTLGRMVHDPSAYERLDSLLLHLDSLVVDVKRDPGRYLSKLQLFSLF